MSITSILRRPILTVAVHDTEARWTLGRHGRIARTGVVPLPAGAVDDGVIVDPAGVGRALRESEAFPRTRRMHVAVALPAQRSVFRQLELPALRGKQFAELVDREIRREMPMLADNAYVSWTRTSERDGVAAVFVVGVARDVLDSHTAAMAAAELRPASADLGVIAAARAVGEPDCIIANIEDNEIELGIFRDGVPSILRFIAMSVPPADPSWSEQLGEELARTLKFYRDSHRDDVSVSQLPISLVGGAAQRAILSPQIAAVTGHELAMPPLRLAVTPESEAVRFAVNVGLVLKEKAA